jgi:hypothetical protein
MKKLKVVVITVLILAVIFLLCKLSFSANRGLDGSGVAYMCTESGTIEGTSSDTPMINPITVLAIACDATTSTDTFIITDGNNADTLLYMTGSQIISFGNGKTFNKGLYVNYIVSGDKIFIYVK